MTLDKEEAFVECRVRHWPRHRHLTLWQWFFSLPSTRWHLPIVRQKVLGKKAVTDAQFAETSLTRVILGKAAVFGSTGCVLCFHCVKFWTFVWTLIRTFYELFSFFFIIDCTILCLNQNLGAFRYIFTGSRYFKGVSCIPTCLSTFCQISRCLKTFSSSSSS